MIEQSTRQLGLVFFMLCLAASSGGTILAEVADGDLSKRIATSQEPPANLYLADSPWPMSHRHPYNQASSPYAGPTRSEEVTPEFLDGRPCPITLAISSPYSDGRRCIWGATVDYVFKVDVSSSEMDYIDRIDRRQTRAEAISGSYSALDLDGNYFVPRGFKIECFRDSKPGDMDSTIEKSAAYELPEKWRGEKDAIVGFNMTFDGWLAFVTRRGVVGCVSRDLMTAHVLPLSKDGETTEISNSIAVDEKGGIFVTTNREVHRVQWDSSRGLRLDWSVPYKTTDTLVAGRLGTGSGTTPTLMGFGKQDRFVVIGDGQELMNLVLIWRDDIPSDWTGLPGRDRRIAAEAPVTFGNAEAERSTTEQSLTVRGHEVVAVSNLYGELSPTLRRFVRRRMGNNIGYATIYRSNQPAIAPWGIEKFTWDPENRKLASTWSNPDISCPNGIPSMSAATGLLYCIGQRESDWTLEGIDWETGESVFHSRLANKSKHNSFYAATEVGLNGSILTGTFGGMLRFSNRAIGGQ